MRGKRKGLSSFSGFLSEWSNNLPEEQRNLLRKERAVKRIQDQFATLVSPYVLEHVNAVYLMAADSPAGRKGSERVVQGTSYAPLSFVDAEVSRSGSEPGSPQSASGQEGSAGSPPPRPLKRRKLVVYVDNSLVSAELNAQRELIRLRYLSDFSIELAGFDIKLSRGGYLNKHPYLDRKEQGASPANTHDVSRETLSEDDLRQIDKVSSTIEDEQLRKAFKRAMTAGLLKIRRNSENNPN